MSMLRVDNFSISADGFGAGPDQGTQYPLGIGGEDLHQWMTTTKTFIELYGETGGTTGTDDELTRAGFENLGAWIMGRNMFGPIRGDWPDAEWKGWWGSNPPYHVPVFVLTNHAREPQEMEGGTIFHFVTGGIDEALDRAKAAADGKDIRLGGGADTIRQYLSKSLIDRLHIAIAPILLGSGEPLLSGLDLHQLGYGLERHVTTPNAMHLVISRQ